LNRSQVACVSQLVADPDEPSQVDRILNPVEFVSILRVKQGSALECTRKSPVSSRSPSRFTNQSTKEIVPLMATTSNWSFPVVRDVIMQALTMPTSEALDASFATSSTFNEGSALATAGCSLAEVPVSS
jgi:hypothetical protein